ncbi:MAG: hypothetical protein JWM72_1136 [Actinomycetia bacterium]|nr:hypothetical protein [Actinomycetes bacterium]
MRIRVHSKAMTVAVSVLALGTVGFTALTSGAGAAGLRAQAANGSGYWLAGSDGGVFAFGTAHFYGSLAGKHLAAPITGIVPTPDDKGYWLTGRDGAVYAFGDATSMGSMAGQALAAPVIGIAATHPAGGAGGTGPQGPAGTRGATGAAGARGSAGANGTAGTNGLPGTPGADGTNGVGAPGADGLRGADGTNGLPGTPGADGTNGLPGTPGADGTNGLPGTPGADGTTGLPGTPGANGTNGVSAAPNFAYIYNLSAGVVAIEADIPFSDNAAVFGFTHLPGSTLITVTNAGTYRIETSVSSVEPAQVAIFVNGAELAGSTYGSGAGTQQDTGHVIVTLAAGDVLTLRNHSSAAAFTLQTLAGGTQTNVNASILIQQLASPPPS